MTNYCLRFIPDYATKTEPLRKLTHKDQLWEWTVEHDHTIEQLKDALIGAPVTAYFDPKRDTEIAVDASPVGLAAILVFEIDALNLETNGWRSGSENQDHNCQTLVSVYGCMLQEEANVLQALWRAVYSRP